MKQIVSRLAVAVVVFATGQSAVADPARVHGTPEIVQTAARLETLIVGRVSADPVKTLPRLQELSAYLAGHLAHLGITSSRAVVARNNEEMVALLRSGDVDLVSETVMSAMLFSNAAGADFLMREWKRGVASYRSLLFARRDSGIAGLDDLGGRVLAFEDPGSTSGFLIPLAILREHGVEAVELPSPGISPPDGKVGYVFIGNEVNIAAWVARGIVDAGALNSSDWEDVDRTPGMFKDQLMILHESPDIPRSVLLARGDLDPRIRDSLSHTLADMENDPAAESVLDTYYQVARYDRFVGDVLNDLNAVRAQYELIQDQFD